MRTGVYVLQLHNGGYYVGKSDNIDARVRHHTSGAGSAWCRHKGGLVGEIPTVFSGSLEDISSWEMNETVTQMLLHGYENVRGWEFTSCTALTSGELDTIKNVIMGQTNNCRKCGNEGHFAHACNSSNVKAKWLLDLETMKNKIASPTQSAMAMAAMSYEHRSQKPVVCRNAAGVGGNGSRITGQGDGGRGRGNRIGITGKFGISGKGGLGQGGGSGFSIRGGGVVKKSMSRSSVFCTRCGRGTHVAENCYARCSVDGKQLDDSEDDDDDDDNDNDDYDDDEF